jgi:CheY-like chemotaxis protein
MSTHCILIVEDHQPTRNVLKMIFHRKGWVTVTAATVAEGLACLALEPRPNCVLLDLDLPDGQGEAVLERVRIDCLPIRVVVCTGSGDDQRWQELRVYRPEAVLQKPVDLAEVCTALTGRSEFPGRHGDRSRTD